jgi:hypothetical protein
VDCDEPDKLKRKTPVDAPELAVSLSQLFNYVDDDFTVAVSTTDTDPIPVTRDLRYGSIEEESRWEIPSQVPNAGEAPAIGGVVIAAKKPLRQDLRGLTIYVKGRLANDPEFFGVPESSYAYSYITGYIDADYLDDHEEDVVATDRRSINWDSPEAAALRDHLASVLREVATLRRETRKNAKKKALRDELDVDVEEWTSTIEDAATASSVRQVLEVAVSPDTELSDKDREALVEGLKEIAPEYADLHWRSLHQDVKEAARVAVQDRPLLPCHRRCDQALRQRRPGRREARRVRLERTGQSVRLQGRRCTHCRRGESVPSQRHGADRQEHPGSTAHHLPRPLAGFP